MSKRPLHPSPITEQADALLAEVERTLAEGDERLRSMGLDPAKVRALADRLTPAQRQEAEAAVRRDLQDVDQEVALEQARLNAQNPGSGKPPKARRFV